MATLLFRTGVILALFACPKSPPHPPNAGEKFTADRRLVIAAFELDVDRVKSLLKAGADPKKRFGIYDANLFADKWTLGYSHIASDKWTPLLAVANSHRVPQPATPTENTSEALSRAMKKMEAIDPKVIRERDERRVAIAKLLVEKKCDIDADDGHGATALSEAIYNQCDSLALFLIEAGAKVNTKVGIYIDGTGDLTPLHYASDNPTLVKALLKHGAKVNVTDSAGDTPLHMAVRDRNVESVRLLVNAGAGVNAKSNDGTTPIYWANGSSEAELKIAAILEKAGAK